MTIAKLAWISGMLGIASIGTVNTIAPLVPDTRLAGFEAEVPAPKPTVRGIWTESFQRDAVRWFDQHWGMRGYLVRTDNTINVALFDETRTGQHVVIGKDGVLFNYEDAQYINRPDPPEAAIDEGRVIARVQRKARAHGHVIVPIIIPSKTSVWREAYPPSHRVRGGFERSDANIYGALVRSLTENGAMFVDARKVLLDEAKRPDEIFTRTSRHWGWRAVCRTLQLAVEAARPEIPELGDEQIDCHTHPDLHPKIEGWELDLFWLLNVWNRVPSDVQGDVIDGKKGGPGLHVPTLFVGTSFFTMATEISRQLDVLQPSLFYYYDARVSNTLTPADARDIEPFTDRWREDTFSKRLILVGILETFSPGDGMKFMAEIEKELDARSADEQKPPAPARR